MSNEKKMQNRLMRVLRRKNSVRNVESFKDAGVLTNNAGFCLKLQDGTKFQITIVEDRRGW